MVEFFGYPRCHVRGMGLCRWEYIGGNECRGAVVPRPIETLIRPVSQLAIACNRRDAPSAPSVPPPPSQYEFLVDMRYDPPAWVWWLVLCVVVLAILKAAMQ